MSDPTNQSAAGVPASERRSLTATFEGARGEIEPLLPRGMKLEFLIASVRLEMEKTPLLRSCTSRSVLDSSARILRRGLEIGVTAYLVPFKSSKLSKERGHDVFEAVDITSYHGLAQLMMQTGIVRGVESEVVYEMERQSGQFDYAYGSDKYLRHKPIEDPTKRGRLIGAYCIVRLPHANWDFKFVTYEEADTVRKTYSKMFKSLDSTPPWYLKKRAVIVMSKLMPKSAAWQEVTEMVRSEEEVEGIERPIPMTSSVNDEDRPQASAQDRTPVDINHMEEERPKQLPAPVPQAQAPTRARTPEEHRDQELLAQDEARFE